MEEQATRRRGPLPRAVTLLHARNKIVVSSVGGGDAEARRHLWAHRRHPCLAAELSAEGLRHECRDALRISARAVCSLVDAGPPVRDDSGHEPLPDALYEAVDDDRLLVTMILDEGGAMRLWPAAAPLPHLHSPPRHLVA